MVPMSALPQSSLVMPLDVSSTSWRWSRRLWSFACAFGCSFQDLEYAHGGVQAPGNVFLFLVLDGYSLFDVPLVVCLYLLMPQGKFSVIGPKLFYHLVYLLDILQQFDYPLAILLYLLLQILDRPCLGTSSACLRQGQLVRCFVLPSPLQV